MRSNKLFIKTVRSLSIYLFIASLIFLIAGLVMYFAQLDNMKNTYGNTFYMNLAVLFLGQIKSTWRIMMLCVSFFGGIQILLLLARNRRRLKRR